MLSVLIAARWQDSRLTRPFWSWLRSVPELCCSTLAVAVRYSSYKLKVSHPEVVGADIHRAVSDGFPIESVLGSDLRPGMKFNYASWCNCVLQNSGTLDTNCSRQHRKLFLLSLSREMSLILSFLLLGNRSLNHRKSLHRTWALLPLSRRCKGMYQQFMPPPYSIYSARSDS